MPTPRRILVAAALVLGAVASSPQAAPPASKPLTFSVLEDYDKGDDLQDVARDFDLMRELGVATWRGSFGWDDYEPEPGRYDFAWLHRFIALAASRGIVLRPYVGYTPAWAAGGAENRDSQAWNQPPKDDRAWRAFVSALAAELRHHANVRSLEIYNEENVAQWWEGTRREYARTLISASLVARRARRLEILHGGLVFPDLDWIEDICASAGGAAAFDILPLHAYPETWTPDGVTVENYLGPGFARDFIAGVDRACGRKRIWINETGFATTEGKSERDQASWWIRAIATFAAEPRIEHVGIYEIKDLAPAKAAIGDTPNYHLGITRVDRTRKLAFGTIKRLVSLFGSSGITPAEADARIEAIEPAGELHQHAFARPDGDRLLFVWNRAADQRLRITPSGDPAALTEYALDGSEVVARIQRPFEIALTRGIPRVFRWTPRTPVK